MRKREEVQKVLRRVKAAASFQLSAVRNELFLCVASAILLILSFPPFDIEFLAWFAFVPLFFALENRSWPEAFLLSYFSGLVFWCGAVYWLCYVSLAGFMLLTLYLAVYFGVFGLLFKLRPMFAVVGWVALEYARSHALTGFPWALLGYSQYLNIRLIQIADIVGIWGISFVVMVVNLAAYTIMKRRYSSSIATAVLCLAMAFSYGWHSLGRPRSSSGKAVLKISVLQGNIPQREKWDKEFRDLILRRYLSLARQAAADKPDLIIWPETALPGVIGEEPELFAYALELAKEVKTPLLIGAVTASSVASCPRPTIGPADRGGQLPVASYYNSAILISKDGKVLNQYDKLHLVPFGEYVPLEHKFPFLRDIIGVPIGDFKPGDEYTIFKMPGSGYKFGVLVCFEDIFPKLVRRFKKDGADFLVNITNDAWFTPPFDSNNPRLWEQWAGFMRSAAPYQHAQASVFRAIENRIPVVRAANTGLSCFIDETGRIYDRVQLGGADIFIAGYKTSGIKTYKK